MTAHANDRAPADIDSFNESWLYRSEGFAEDLDDVAPAVVAAPVADTPRRRPEAPSAPWSAALTLLWQARAQGAR